MSTLQTKEEAFNREGTGIIVGRFQVAELHEGHLQLIDSVIARHESVIVVLGIAPTRGTTENPLDFASRKQMFAETYPDVTCLYINDTQCDREWSRQLDKLISTNTAPGQPVCLYGSRSGFVSYYHGSYPTRELVQTVFTSGTEERKKAVHVKNRDKSYRMGCIANAMNRYATCYMAVDVALIQKNVTEGGPIVYLVGKPGEQKYRFPGGFIEPNGNDNYDGNFLEDNAQRECNEETSVVSDNYRYVSSFRIDDWRYRGEKDKIASTLFIADYVSGTPEPKDDVDRIKLFNLHHFVSEEFMQENLVKEHIPLMKGLLKYIEKHGL